MKVYTIVLITLVIVLLALVFMFPKSPAVFEAPVLTLPSKPSVGVPLGASGIRDLKSADEAREFIKSKGMLMVYATWCGHCKAMMPAIEEASTKTSVPIARIEAAFAGDFTAQHEIRGFPTLMVTASDGTLGRHMGGRDVDSLLAALA